MAQNIVVSFFEVESEAYQAITELKQNAGDEKSFLSEAILVKKENGALRTLDGFDTGIDTANDAAIGGLVGGLVGILGGPIGVLLGGAYGILVGSVIDAGDAADNMSLIEQIAGKMQDGEVAIVGLSTEEDKSVLDRKLQKFKTVIERYDAAAVAEEVKRAQMLADEMARQARRELRAEKASAFKAKIEGKLHLGETVK